MSLHDACKFKHPALQEWDFKIWKKLIKANIHYKAFRDLLVSASEIEQEINKNQIETALGAAYGTAKSGTGIAAMSVMRPELIMKSIIPVVMAGIIAIYGLVVSVLIAQGMNEPAKYSLFK